MSTTPYTVTGFRGKVTDSDSNEIGQVAMLEALNVDAYTGEGLIDIRPPLVLNEGLVQFSFGSGKSIYQILSFATGIEAVQWNIFIVYRSDAMTGSDYTWTFATNAPSGGNGNAYTDLSGSFLAPTCRATGKDGVIEVALGNADEGMIFKNLCELGDRELPDLTISSSDPVTPAGLYNRNFGEGGKIYAGWLWDYKKLYTNYRTTAIPNVGSFTYKGYGETTIAVQFQLTSVAGGAVDPLPGGPQEWFAALVYDDDPQQFGLPILQADKDGIVRRFTPDDGEYGVTVTLVLYDGAVTNPNYNRRITGIAIYCRRALSIAQLEDVGDFERVTTIPFDDGSWSGGTRSIFIDGSALLNGEESTWTADSGGRPILQGPWAEYTAAELAALSDPQAEAAASEWWDAEMDKISVKATGLLFHRETMYAYGINDNPGQGEIAYSSFGPRRGMPDVFIPLNVMTKGNHLPVTYLTELNDRLLMFQPSDIYMIEPPTSNGLNTVEQIGTGTRVGTSIPRSIVKGSRGVYFCNQESIYEIAPDGTIEDILYEKRKDEWNALSSSVKSAAVGHYNGKLEEYWLLIDGTIWIFRTKYRERYWRDYSFDSAITVEGFYTDEEDGVTRLYGTHTTMGDWIGELTGRTGIDFEDADYGGPGNYAGDEIPWAIETQKFGPRNNQMLLDYADFQRRTSTDTAPSVKLYANSIADPSVTLKFPSTRKKRANFKPLRCNEARIRMDGSVDATSSARIRIYEISVGTKRTEKRRQ